MTYLSAKADGASIKMNTAQIRIAQNLNEVDRQRLEDFAPLFDVVVERLPEGPVSLRVLDIGGWRESRINPERLHTRLLAELCEKTLRWVYFPVGQPCHEALLGLADKRIRRIAELYRQQKSALLNLDDEEVPALA
jgi:hypothetical protein